MSWRLLDEFVYTTRRENIFMILFETTCKYSQFALLKVMLLRTPLYDMLHNLVNGKYRTRQRVIHSQPWNHKRLSPWNSVQPRRLSSGVEANVLL